MNTTSPAPAPQPARGDAVRHSPAPWTMGRVDEHLIRDAKGHSVGRAFYDAFGDNQDEADANARLMRAAPDLYAALVRLDAFWTGDHSKGPDDPERIVGRLSDETVSIWREIRAALAKAHARQEPSHAL